jgi:hypothetical protein
MFASTTPGSSTTDLADGSTSDLLLDRLMERIPPELLNELVCILLAIAPHPFLPSSHPSSSRPHLLKLRGTVQDLVDDMTLEVVFEMHRKLKRGHLCLNCNAMCVFFLFSFLLLLSSSFFLSFFFFFYFSNINRLSSCLVPLSILSEVLPCFFSGSSPLPSPFPSSSSSSPSLSSLSSSCLPSPSLLTVLYFSISHSDTVDKSGFDIYGQSIKAAPSEVFECINCKRSVAASRFAPHLEKCMGQGRNSSRLANKRLNALSSNHNSSASSSFVSSTSSFSSSLDRDHMDLKGTRILLLLLLVRVLVLLISFLDSLFLFFQKMNPTMNTKMMGLTSNQQKQRRNQELLVSLLLLFPFPLLLRFPLLLPLPLLLLSLFLVITTKSRCSLHS